MLLWIKQRLTYFKLQKSGIGNESSHIRHTFSERFQLYMSVTYQGWFVKFWQNVKMFQLKQRNVMQEQSKQPQVNKI